MKATEKKTLREPESEYDCWCMDCNECVYYDSQNEECTHPDRYLGGIIAR